MMVTFSALKYTYTIWVRPKANVPTFKSVCYKLNKDILTLSTLEILGIFSFALIERKQ